MDPAASVRILARLDDPHIVAGGFLLICKVVVTHFKPFKLGVLARFYVKGQGDRHLKGVKVQRLVVLLKVREKCLFVGQMIVGIELAVHQIHLVLGLYQVLVQVSFAPLGPNKVRTLNFLTVAVLLICLDRGREKLFIFGLVPPASLLQDLAD